MLKYIDYIYAVYQEKSITKAAKKLYISQPWLSNIVKKVEEELQAPLFKRNTGSLTLTDAGKFYIQHIEQIIHIKEEMDSYFYKHDSSTLTTIRIGSGSIFCIYILPKLLKKFCESHPQIQISFHEGANQELTQKLLDHQIDLYIECNPIKDDAIETVLWEQEELVLAIPVDHPLNKIVNSCAYSSVEYKQRQQLPEKPFLPLSLVKDIPFISASPGNDSYQRGLDICLDNDFTPKYIFFTSSQLTSYSMACQGLGATFTRSIIPDFLPDTSAVKFYRLENIKASRDIYLSYAKDIKDNHLQELINTIQNSDLAAFR